MSQKNNKGMLGRHAAACQVFGLLTLVLVGLAMAADEAPKVVNPQAVRLKNPLPSDVPTVDAGRELYLTHCASCHGKKGKGDGGQALGGGTPSDLTDADWDYGSTDGEIYWVIREGIESNADMLAYKKTLSEKETWQVVVFIRSLGPQKK